MTHLTGAIVQLRSSSKRFPKKVFSHLDSDISVLDLLSERLQAANSLDLVIFATTSSRCDDRLAEVLSSKGLLVFRGSENDLVDRYLSCASEFGLEVIVRITADCPLVDPETIDFLVESHKHGDYALVSNSEPLPSQWADGSDVSVFSTDSLRELSQHALSDSEREHLTHGFWKRQGFRFLHVPPIADHSRLRYTLDYPEDLEVLSAIVSAFRSAHGFPRTAPNYSSIVGWLEQNPQVVGLNSHHYRGEGWN